MLTGIMIPSSGIAQFERPDPLLDQLAIGGVSGRQKALAALLGEQPGRQIDRPARIDLNRLRRAGGGRLARRYGAPAGDGDGHDRTVGAVRDRAVRGHDEGADVGTRQLVALG